MKSAAARLLAALAILLSNSGVDAAATDNYFLQLVVPKGDGEGMLGDIQKLRDFAKEQKLHDKLQIMLGTAHIKVSEGNQKEKKALEKKRKLEEKRKQKEEAQGFEFFTTKPLAVRPFKDSMSSGKKCNVKKYTDMADFAAKLAQGKINMNEPFILPNAVDELESLRAKWNSAALKKIPKSQVTLTYLSPKMAKLRRQEGAAQEKMEVFQPEYIGFERYFDNCFGQKRSPGTHTEHCEQVVSATKVDPEMSKYNFKDFATGPLGLIDKMEAGQRRMMQAMAADTKFADMTDDSEGLLEALDERLPAKKFFVIGPTGSGEQIRFEETPFVDGLIHGKRRWFFITEEFVVKLKEKAGNDFSAVSAFQFFEEQYAELKEEWGMTSDYYYECDQTAGDVVFVPARLYRTSLSMEDSISVKKRTATDGGTLLKQVNGQVWSPMQQSYNLGGCYSPEEIQDLGGWFFQGQAKMIANALAEQYDTPKKQNMMILSVLHSCAGLFALKDDSGGVAIEWGGDTLCHEAWGVCTKKMEANLKDIGVSWPAWLDKSAATKAGGSGKKGKAGKTSGGGAGGGGSTKAKASGGTKKKSKSKKKKSKKKKGKKEL